MQEYKSGQELIQEIEKAAKLFIAEFEGIEDSDHGIYDYFEGRRCQIHYVCKS